MKKYRQQLSPERSKVWKEKPPKYYKNRKVPVVYYLCRNRQLEHPHFMEVPISSPDGLFLRGKNMELLKFHTFFWGVFYRSVWINGLI